MTKYAVYQTTLAKPVKLATFRKVEWAIDWATLMSKTNTESVFAVIADTDRVIGQYQGGDILMHNTAARTSRV
jgi:hypothetical protein